MRTRGASEVRSRQQELHLPTWGGRRAGAGRKRRPGRRRMPHGPRPVFGHRCPLHITIRVADHVYNLRSRRARSAVERMLRGCAGAFGVSIVQVSVQGNHIHLLVEAPDQVSLSRAMKGMGVRLARCLNKLMGRTGPVLGDRYHARRLRTPTEVTNTIHYIRNNFRKHEAQCGRHVPASFVDPCSSDGELAALVSAPTVWLLCGGLRGPPPSVPVPYGTRFKLA